ncbi:MAG TPA: PEGA domain-containing protein [Polyangia bacterium]|nr:PEGA domain-containing protein [Polyangia bacterium]
MPEPIELRHLPRRRLGRALPVSLLACALLATRAHAVEVAPESEEALIERGIALREARDDSAALELFRKAYELKKGGRALAQAALAEQALARWVAAEGDLQQALSRGDDAWIARNKALLNQALVEIQDHLGWLQVDGGVAGAEVVIDGVVAGKLPLATAARAPAGSVALQVRAPGYLPYARTVNVPKRTATRETVALMPAVAAAPPADEASGTGAWSARKKVGLGLGAAAVVSAAVGTTFIFVRDGRARTFNDAGCGTAALTPDCGGLRDKAETAKVIGVAGLLGAAVLGGVSAYLLLAPGGAEPGQVARAGLGASLRCAPSPEGGMSIACVGRF